MHDAIVNVLAVIGAIACVIWAIQAFKTSPGQSASQPEDAVGAVGAAPPEPRSETIDSDIAVIAAAVYAMLGSGRAVHIDGHRDMTWTSEGRWMQQTSHRPH